MLNSQPLVAVLAGPNGAGKSTAASTLLPDELPFLNADEIAKSLPGYPSQGADIEAGRILLQSLDDLERRHASFAMETTLASRSLAPRIARLRRSGYLFHLIYVWTPSAEFSIQRVAERVRLGGHSVPEDTIRRRYEAGLKNLFHLYLPLSDLWTIYANTDFSEPRPLAQGVSGKIVKIVEKELWDVLCERVSDAKSLPWSGPADRHP